MSFEVLSLITKNPTFSKGVKNHVCMSDFMILPSRLQLSGPGWAPDPLSQSDFSSVSLDLDLSNPWFYL